MLQSELMKLRKDLTLRVICIFIVIYIFSGPLFSAPNVQEFFQTAGTGELLSGFTTDTAFMMMLIGLVSAAVFAAEFSTGTIHNILFAHSRTRTYLIKTVSVLITAFLMLFLWYACGYIYTAVSRCVLPSSAELMNYSFRFSVQYLLVIMQTGFITVLGIITGRRAIANISTIFFWIATAFIPINGDFSTNFIENQYEWGTMPSPILYAVLGGICIFLYSIGLVLFKRKEIKN